VTVQDAQGNLHRGAGTPDGGQFDAKHNARPGSMLSGASVADAKLLDALALWGLTPADLPGIEAAWTARFSALDEPEPESSVRAAAAVLDLDRDYSGWSSARVLESGGRVRVEVVVIDTDEDEDLVFEREDAETYHLIVPEGPGADRVRAGVANDEAVKQRRHLLAEQGAFADGTRPVWHLLANPVELEELDAARLDAELTCRRTSHPAQEARTFGRDWESAREGAAGAAAPTSVPYQTVLRAPAAWVQPEEQYVNALGRTITQKRPREMRVYDVLRTSLNFSAASAAHERLARAVAEAEALPAGELRDFLLADRPERTYTTTEGTGRNKRQVPHTYRPKSELVKDAESAAERFGRERPKYEAMRADLTAWGRLHDEAILAHDVALAQRDAAELAWRGAGWPSGTPVPEHRAATSAESL